MMHTSRIAILTFLQAFATVTLLAGCGSRSDILAAEDCLAQGTCECRGPQDCAAGQHCVNGKCGVPTDGGALLAFGMSCSADDQCASGFCIPNAKGDGSVCTRMCTGHCPDTWECKVRVGDQDVSLCAQKVDKLCADCSVDGHCNPAFGDYCVELQGVQSCGRDCNYAGCPSGYSCQTLEVHGHAAKQCVPLAGTCVCSAQTAGLTRACNAANTFGTCTGATVCQASGDWSPCSAKEPSREVCNGIDDDCNGFIDALDPGVDTSSLAPDPPYPTCIKGAGVACKGAWACQSVGDTYDWVCAAVDPQPEVCDGIDNNCDGTIDEPFVDAQGRYVQPTHCGSCKVDCTTVLKNVAVDTTGAPLPGAVDCKVLGDTPTCVPVQCAPGFYPYPADQPVMCHPLASPQCRPCTTVSDCSVPQDRCATVGLDDHTSCLQGCGPDSAYQGCTGQIGTQDCCPDHATCQLVGGVPACVPDGQSCECDKAHDGTVRSCVLSGQATAKCVGTQKCGPTPGGNYTWAACDTSVSTIEICDGKDNNCNGKTDEGFLDTKGTGTYDTDHHCGVCNHDCTAQWSPTIQHAIGGCQASTATSPTCKIAQCTKGTVGGGGSCQLDKDCPAGWSCNAPYFQCVKTCSTSPDCGTGGVCSEGTCTSACTSTAECTSKYGSPSTCVAGLCKAEYQFNDVDQADTNGCECPIATGLAGDSPDIYPAYPDAGVPYVDRNCDGVDGEAAYALYVWGGSDQSLGTREHPFKTIGEAVKAFDPTKHHHVLVASGQYHETVVLTSGMQLFGGYSSTFAKRDIVGYPTLIVGPEPNAADPNAPKGVVNATGIKSQRTVVAGFAIYGFDVAQAASSGTAGKSSYAVYLQDCSDQLVIANNLIFGGRGGDGGHGGAGQAGGAGNTGISGLDSKECNSASCGGETQAGGTAGTNPTCGGTVGNPGAGANGSMDPQGYNPATGLNGRGGTNARYSAEFNPAYANLCKYDCQIAGDLNGLDAQSGPNGQSGTGGQGCSSGLGAIINGEWRGYTAGSGFSGAVGRGGGGGGAGGCVMNFNPATCTVGNRRGDLGGTGGGGGAGGCGGGGGKTGGTGGGSFALFLAYTANPGNAVPKLSGNVVYVGEGGAGGDGAYGGHGGAGGPGGFGGISKPPAWCAGYGGRGGRGGDGGPGGGAGGGCGGVAFGIAGTFISAAQYDTFNSFVQPAGSSGGPGGAGGPSPAGGSSNGTSGTIGVAGVIHAY